MIRRSPTSARLLPGIVIVWLSLSGAVLLSAQEPPPAPVANPTSAPAPAVASRDELKSITDRIRVGAYGEAETALATLQKTYPDDPSVLLLHGEVLLAMDRVSDALPVLRHCAELAPQRARVNFQLATALEKSGDAKGALEAYGKEIEVNRDSQVQVFAHLNRYLLLERAKDANAAMAELEAVIALEPTRAQVYGDLATLQIEAGRLDDASATLERGTAAGLQSSRHYQSLAGRYYEKKSYDSAIAAFNKALAVDPTFADAELGLGGALDQAGKTAEAAQHFQRYLELRPASPEAKRVSERLRAIRGH
jgi:protein O-GlcNAc transferase